MRPNPLSDLISFLFAATWQAGVFGGLLVASLLIAIVAFRRARTPPGLSEIGIWVLRVTVGGMWWQQSLWKVPPDFDGLLHWLGEMVDHAAIPLQSVWVRDNVIPQIQTYGRLIYGTEVIVAVSLILGVLSRFGALLGLLMAGNLWLGLYSAPGEWPWTYVFLCVIQALWVIDAPGRSLGIDSLLAGRR